MKELGYEYVGGDSFRKRPFRKVSYWKRTFRERDEREVGRWRPGHTCDWVGHLLCVGQRTTQSEWSYVFVASVEVTQLPGVPRINFSKRIFRCICIVSKWSGIVINLSIRLGQEYLMDSFRWATTTVSWNYFFFIKIVITVPSKIYSNTFSSVYCSFRRLMLLTELFSQ